MFWITEDQLNSIIRPGLRTKRRAAIAADVKSQIFASETLQINRIALHKAGANIDHAPPGSPEIFNAEPILIRARTKP